MTKFLALTTVVFVGGCALTAPEGHKELLDDIARDKGTQYVAQDSFVGRPLFLKVRVYPRIDGGNIAGKHWLLMKVGNEKLDLNPLLNDINNETK